MIYTILALIGISGALIAVIRSQKKKYRSLEFKFNYIEKKYDQLAKNKKKYEETIGKLQELNKDYEMQIKDVDNSHGSDLSDNLNGL